MAVTEELVVRASWQGQGLSRGTNQAARDLSNMEKAARQVGTALKGMGLVLSVGAVLRLGNSIKQTADEWTNISNRVKLFTRNAAEATKVQEALFNISQKTRATMGATTELFQRLAQANKQLGLDQKSLQGVLTTLNQTLVISGTSAESAKAGLIQLGQAFASGQLRGEELRSVMEQMPRLTIALTEGLGTTVSGLRAMAEAGELTSNRVIEAIQSQAEVINTEFGGMEMTVEQAGTALENSLGRAIDRLNETTNATVKLAKALQSLADLVDILAEPAPVVTRSDLQPGGGRVGLGRRGGGKSGLQAAIRDAARQFDFQGPQQDLGAAGFAEGNPVAFLGVDRSSQGLGLGLGGQRTQSGLGGIGGPLTQRTLDSVFETLQGALGGLGGIGGRARSAVENENIVKNQAADLSLLNQLRVAEAGLIKEENDRAMELLAARQEMEKQTAVDAQLGAERIQQLDAIHELEREGLGLRQQERAQKKAIAEEKRIQDQKDRDAEKAAAAAAAAASRELQEFNANMRSIGQIATQVAPELGIFASGMIQLLTGPTALSKVSGALSLFQGLTGVLSGGGDAAAEMAREEQRLSDIRRDSANTSRSVLSRLGGGEFETRAKSQTDAIKGVLDDLIESGMSQFDAVETLLHQGRQIDLGFGDTTALFDALGGPAGIGVFQQLWEQLFGDSSIGNAIEEMLDLNGAFDSVGSSAKALADTMNREITAAFDVQEGLLRDQARTELRAAGGDTFEQARIFRALRGDLTSLAAAEKAANAVGGGGAGTAGTGTTGGGGNTGGGAGKVTASTQVTVDTMADVIDLSNAEKITINWPDAIILNDKYGINGNRPQHWGDVINVNTLKPRASRIMFDWPDAIFLNDKYGINGNRPQHWGDVIAKSTLDRAAPLSFPWTEAVQFTHKLVLDDWSDLFTGSIVSRDKTPMQFTGGIPGGVAGTQTSDAFHLHRLLLDDWSDMFFGPIVSRRKDPMRFTGGIPGGVAGTRMSDAFRLHRLLLDDWSDMFFGPIVSRDKAPMIFTGGVYGLFAHNSNAFRLNRIYLGNWNRLFWGPIIDRTMPPMQIDAASVFELVGRVDVGSLFTADSIRGAIVDAVERAIRDRTFTRGPTGF